MVGFNRRFDPSFRACASAIHAGEIGRLEQVIITSRDPAPPPAAYMAGSGGLFRDMTIHDFDIARFFVGEIGRGARDGRNLIDPESAKPETSTPRWSCCAAPTAAVPHHQQPPMHLRLRPAASRPSATACSASGTRCRRASAVRRRRQHRVAPPYLNFFIHRYTAAYRAELDHFSRRRERHSPSPRVRRRPGCPRAGRSGQREPAHGSLDHARERLTASAQRGRGRQRFTQFPGALPRSSWVQSWIPTYMLGNRHPLRQPRSHVQAAVDAPDLAGDVGGASAARKCTTRATSRAGRAGRSGIWP